MALAYGPQVAVTTTMERITPAMAKRMLGNNTHNRTVTLRRVATLAHAIVAGQWVLNGESIKFSASGRLLDGQHRLLAIIEADTAIITLVVRGLPEHAQETVDTGDPRSLADTLQLRNERDTTLLASGIRTALIIERRGQVDKPEYPTKQDMLGYLEAHPALRESLPAARQARHSDVRYPGGQAVGLHYHMAMRDRDQADEFWHGIASGVDLAEGSPVLALRRRMIRDRDNHGAQPHLKVRLATAIKAWNMYRSGRSASFISWRGGDSPESFPEVI